MLMFCKFVDKIVSICDELFNCSISEILVTSQNVSKVTVVLICFLSVHEVISVPRLDWHSDALFDKLRFI